MRLLSTDGNINEQSIVQFLFNTGHFNNPEMPTEVKIDDLYKLSIGDEETKIALESYKTTYSSELDEIKSNGIFQYRIKEDNQIDDATINLLMMDRCGLPDFDIMSTGSGSWPAGCHPKWPRNHAITIRVNKSRMPQWWNDIFEVSWNMVVEAYAHIGIVFVREDNNSNANITITWERGNGWTGLAIVPRNPRCGDRIWAKFDTRYRPNDMINRFAYLIAHELGHNMGLSHSRGGVMNAILTNGTFRKEVWVGDPHWPTMKRWFSGIPVIINKPAPPITPITPKPKPPITTPSPTPPIIPITPKPEPPIIPPKPNPKPPITIIPDKPPADKPPADKPPADKPPADKPPADKPPNWWSRIIKIIDGIINNLGK